MKQQLGLKHETIDLTLIVFEHDRKTSLENSRFAVPWGDQPTLFESQVLGALMEVE